ncbi:MAG: hypothetical protein K5851_02255 [Lachnospiraceae bacterium]|nr:hypothetical protein [Lachnospiraceae bacterium]
MFRLNLRRITSGILISLLIFSSILILIPSRVVNAAIQNTLIKNGSVSIEGANTSRNLAVEKNGTIHVVYKENGNIYYTKSTDKGASFGSKILVVEGGSEAEIAVSSNGRIFVAYILSSKPYIAYSDNGTTFTPVKISESDLNVQSPSLHIATDNTHVYAINRSGTTFFRSSDNGISYTTITGWDGYAFSDVMVDTSNHKVIVIKDRPQVVIRTSSDYGATFSDEAAVMNGESQIHVYYSTASIGNGNIYIAGQEGIVYVINYSTATAVGTSVEALQNTSMEDVTGRSLSSDNSKHVISGSRKDGKVLFQLSSNMGSTFEAPVEVGEATQANAAINTNTGDVLFLYVDSEGLKLYTIKGVVEASTPSEPAAPTTPTTPVTKEPHVAGRGGAVDSETLKTEYAGITPKENSAAAASNLSTNQVISTLASTNTAAKTTLVTKAVEKGNLKLNVNTDKKKISATVDVPATLLSALSAREMMDGLLGLDDIVVDLEVKVTTKDNVSKPVSNAIESVKNTGEELFYFDADMFLTKNGTNKENITEFGDNKINITVDIPEAIQGSDRIFRLIRTHKNVSTGKIEVDTLEDQDTNVNTFTLSTNKLCTMAFAYKQATVLSPKTGTNSVALIMFVLSLSSILLLINKKNNI